MMMIGLLLLQIMVMIFEVTCGPVANPQVLVRGNTEFGLKLYEGIAKEQPGDNIFFSPASISFVLALTLLGARGDTLKELKETLHLANIPDKELLLLFKEVTNVLLETDDKYQLHVANRLFGDKEFVVLPEYLQRSKQIFGSELAQVNFKHDPTGAAKIINDWVSQQTNNKIKDLMPPDAVDEMTRLVLVNAIYFKGDWQTKI